MDLQVLLSVPEEPLGQDLPGLFAVRVLKPDGRLMAICANGPRQQEIMGEICSAWIDLPTGTFKEQGTNVNVTIVVIDV